MTAPEIIDSLRAGNAVELNTRYVMAFLRECERLELDRLEISLKFIGTHCVLTIPQQQQPECLSINNRPNDGQAYGTKGAVSIQESV